MEQRTWSYRDGYTRQDPAVIAAAEKIGATDMPGGYYAAELENWADGDILTQAIADYNARQKAETDEWNAKRRARQGNPYAEFNPSDNDDGERNH